MIPLPCTNELIDKLLQILFWEITVKKRKACINYNNLKQLQYSVFNKSNKMSEVSRGKDSLTLKSLKIFSLKFCY